MGQIVFWVLAEKDGKKTLFGGYSSKDKAEEIGEAASDGDNYEIFPLETIDKASAKSQIKAILFDKTHDLQYSLERIKKSKDEDIA